MHFDINSGTTIWGYIRGDEMIGLVSADFIIGGLQIRCHEVSIDSDKWDNLAHAKATRLIFHRKAQNIFSQVMVLLHICLLYISGLEKKNLSLDQATGCLLCFHTH